MGIVKNDPWLEPVAVEVYDRWLRYSDALREIEHDFGNLEQFADAYHYFGINFDTTRNGWTYREWAPKALDLFLTGDFNGWKRDTHRLTMNDFGIWEIFLSREDYHNTFVHGSKIKVLVHSPDGWRERIPAYIRYVVQDMKTLDFTGVVWLPDEFNWEDDHFDASSIESPFIYECHTGMAQEFPGIGTYRQFAENILPRIKIAGYNVIQIMAIAEHPYYGSFGYHVSNFFVPSSRFGTPEELKELIKKAHSMGIAVVMDIVHSHTVKNINEGLNRFDGSDNQYFHPGERGEHPMWDSRLFDYGKTEVKRFLLSNLKYWLKEFHFDGFRFDGVASMIYFHHGYDIPFGSLAKYFRQGIEYDGITYLMLANHLIHAVNPHALSIAEEVSGMPGLTSSVDDGGLGFDYRLGMGIPDYWIRLLKEKPDEEWNIHEMWQTVTDRNFGVKTVAYAESHDQAMVGDKTLAFWLMDKEMYFHMQINDNNPIIDRGIALHKMLRLFTISLGGNAYMNFIGNEFGHPEWIDFPREGNNWSYQHARRQWSLADDIKLKYHYLAAFDHEMLLIAGKYKIMNAGFPRQLNMDEVNKTIVFERGGLIFLFNFHPNHSIPGYEFMVPQPGDYRIILSTDHASFGGHERVDDLISYPTYYDKETKSWRLRIYNTCRTAMVMKNVGNDIM
ncbi:MAG: alpha amylase C-terminal domain-containing protein [Bacteroidia bacterium]|nr:alpha amylase C-terminal domain-containing protein [Bacteroidia bacterium]